MMGCCESCFGSDPDKEPNERSRLLQNNGPINTQPVPNVPDLHHQTPQNSLSQSQPDEESMLNGILKKYSDDVIDVSAMETRIDAVEYMNRAQHYNRKLAGIMCNPNDPKLSRSAVFDTEKLFKQLNEEDLLFATNAAKEISEAVRQIKVIAQQDITVSLAHA